MAQAWSSLGASVTLVEAVDRIARRRGAVRERARSPRGSRPSGSSCAPASRRPAPRAARAARSRCSSRTARSCAATSCWSRSGGGPRTAELGLETVGVEGGGYLEVDDSAAGRRLGLAVRDRRRQRARAAHPHGQVPGADLRRRHPRQGGRPRPRDLQGSPRVVFTEPQVAAVGWTLEQATERGIAARAVDVQTSANAGASFIGRNAPGHLAARRRHRARGGRRRDLRRPRDRRVAARGDDRGRRRGAPLAPLVTRCRRSRPAARSG